MARYNKKRARELKHDAFRDKTMEAVDKIGNRLEGKGRQILYAIGIAVVAVAAIWGMIAWRQKKNDEARRALGRAIEIAEAPVSATPAVGATGPTFTNEKDRAQQAITEFQKVAAKYSGQTRDLANYFIAANQVSIDKGKGTAALDALTKDSDVDISTRAKFALASEYESEAKYDQAAAIYKDLAQAGKEQVPADLANLSLAKVYEKQGKKSEAVELLFNIASASRKAVDKAGKPLPASSSGSDAERELEKLDSAKFATLPARPQSEKMPF